MASIVGMDTVITPQPASREAVAIFLFGPLAMREGTRSLGDRDLGGARRKHVLAIHLAARCDRVPTDRLADLRWGEHLAQNAAAPLQTFISVLRRRLSADLATRARELLVTGPEAYRFAIEPANIDHFDQLLEGSNATWAEDLRSSYRGHVLGALLDAAQPALADRDYAAAVCPMPGRRSASTGSPSAPTEARCSRCTRSAVPRRRSTQLPPYVAVRTAAKEVREVPIP